MTESSVGNQRIGKVCAVKVNTFEIAVRQVAADELCPPKVGVAEI